MTDHDRLLAATHDHARDWRDGKAGGGRAGWHERVFRKRTVGWTIARCLVPGNLPCLAHITVGQLSCSISNSCAIPVGAGMPANTGEARAIHRGACFAGMPAPTGVSASVLVNFSPPRLV
ncbi:hypothetical protein D3C81_1597550 [compost metagenome]